MSTKNSTEKITNKDIDEIEKKAMKQLGPQRHGGKEAYMHDFRVFGPIGSDKDQWYKKRKKQELSFRKHGITFRWKNGKLKYFTKNCKHGRNYENTSITKMLGCKTKPKRNSKRKSKSKSKRKPQSKSKSKRKPQSKSKSKRNQSKSKSKRKPQSKSKSKRETKTIHYNLTDTEKKDMEILQNLTRKVIQSKYIISGKTGKEGTTFIATGESKKEYAIKLFKKTKSKKKIHDEAYYQSKAAEKNITPRVLGINLEANYIIMEKLEHTIVDYYKEILKKDVLTKKHQQRLIEICEKLDEVNIIQNDGNPLNLMLNDKGDLMIIDFGYAKTIDEKMLKKRGPEPNINLTLWHIQRNLKFYKLKSPLLKTRVQTYMNSIK